MIPTLYIRLGLVAGVLLLVWYTYNQGVEAGVNQAVSQYAESQNKAVIQYQADIKKAAEGYDRELLAIRRQYEAEAAEQFEQAQNMARQIAETNTAESEIRERIRYVESNNIGDDAYKLYQRTRQLIRDPRNTEVEDPTTSTTPNK